MPGPGVLFDVDGTLVDSTYIHAFLSGGVPEADLRAAGAVEVYDGPAHLLAEISTSLIAMLDGH